MKNMEHVVETVKGLTEENAHTTAISEAARLLGFTRLYECARLLQQLQDREGYMPEDLLGYRRTLRNRLLQAAKEMLNPDEYDALYNAF